MHFVFSSRTFSSSLSFAALHEAQPRRLASIPNTYEEHDRTGGQISLLAQSVHKRV